MTSLRTRTARGTMINTGFQVGLAGIGLLQRVGLAAFLTRDQYAVWGILLAVLFTLIWVKQIGIGDKYIQQDEPDQEAAFQKAFTLELGMSVIYCAVCAVAIPLYALAYGHPEIIAPGLVVSISIFLTAFETPVWIPYRRMDYARQRVLSSIDPVLTAVLTLGLAAAGFGVWGLVVGSVAGSLAGAAVCVATCPYRLRLRFERGTFREYASFSWPLLGFGFSQMLVIQGSLLLANRAVGLAGVGAIGLTAAFLSFSDGVDSIVSSTIYPAVCAVVDRTERLAEVFEKSNRIALMWALPFTVALALFAADLNHFFFHDRWTSAVGLLIAIALCTGVGQLGFNWGLFMRATNRTRPLFIASLADLATFFLVTVPAMFAFGLTGYAVGIATTTITQVALRALYMHRMFPTFSFLRQFARAVAPVAPAVAAILGLRALSGGDKSLVQVLAEAALYAVLAIAFTWLFERRLITELAGYLRGRVARGTPTLATGT